MKRDWDKLKRQDRASKPLSRSQFNHLRLQRLMAWRRQHPEARDWKIPAGVSGVL